MANFCINCGSKLEDDYNYCINCGSKIDKSDIKHHNTSLNQHSDSIEKKKAKQKLNIIVGGRFSFDNTFRKKLVDNGLDPVKTRNAIKQQVETEIDSGQIKSGGVEYRVNQLIGEYKIKMENEKEEEKKILKLIDEIFESEEIKSEIRKNNIGQIYIISIKNSLKYKLFDKKENMSGDEIKHYIKKELIKASKKMENARIAKEKETSSKEIVRNEITHGGYCNLSCVHFYEEFLDSGGAIVGDFDAVGLVDYYCDLGHSVIYGSFCKDYE